MASIASMAMKIPAATAEQRRQLSDAFMNPLPVKLIPSKSVTTTSSSKRSKFGGVRASLKEKAITGLTAAALTASMVIPDVAEAAESAAGISPSLKNFLLSIVAGGVVAAAIAGAVVGVSNFDPVKRSN